MCPLLPSQGYGEFPAFGTLSFLINVSLGTPDRVNRPGFHIYEAATSRLSSIMSGYNQPFHHYKKKNQICVWTRAHRKDCNETKHWDLLGTWDTSPGFDWHDVCWHLAVLYTNSTDGLNEVKHSTDLESTWPCFPFQLNSTSKHKLKCCSSVQIRGLQREERRGDRSERDLLGDWRSFSQRILVEEFSQTKEECLKLEHLFV